jgi:hypothetical protein
MNAASDNLRAELAVIAARLVADEGCSYGQAKRRAAHELLGEAAVARAQLPDNAEIELEVRRHLQLYAAATHPQLLAALRRLAARLMEQLAEFNPHLTGPVLSGVATEHSDIDLHLYTDSAKDVELRLLNDGRDFDVDEGVAEDHPVALERISFVVPAREPGLPAAMRVVGVRLHVFDSAAVRVAPRHRSVAAAGFDLHPVAAGGRANLSALRQLIAATESEAS